MMSRLALAAAAAAGLAFVGCAEQPMFNVGAAPAPAPAAFASVVPSPYLPPPPSPSVAPDAGSGIVGLQLGVVSGGVSVQAVVPGSSAADAGVAPGDLLLAVDGDTVGAMTLAQIRRRIRGPEGTSVVVRFQRGDDAPVDRALARRPFRPAAPVASSSASPEAAMAERAPAGDNSDVETRLLP